MSELAQWQKGNEEYLAAALNWLRLLLSRHVSQAASPAETVQRSAHSASIPSEAETRQDPGDPAMRKKACWSEATT